MAWLAVDKDGSEYKYYMYPLFNEDLGCWEAEDIYNEDEGCLESYCEKLHKGSIEKLIGKKLTWKDEPVEI